jgi:hypothetical protein
MSACYQNAWLLMKTIPTPIITFRQRPCMSAAAEELLRRSASVEISTANSTSIIWYSDGRVKETLSNGDITLFPVKPTYASFLTGSYQFTEFSLGEDIVSEKVAGNYLEFHGDGSVIYRTNGTTFLWTTEFPTEPIRGIIYFTASGIEDEDVSTYERSDTYS